MKKQAGTCVNRDTKNRPRVCVAYQQGDRQNREKTRDFVLWFAASLAIFLLRSYVSITREYSA